MTLVRPLPEGLVFPCDWGFIPSTLAPDGDPLDAIVVWDRSTFPGVVLPCRVLGMLAVEQNSRRQPGTRERNDRVIAVPRDSAPQSVVRSVDDLPERLKRELEAFFVASTAFENKDLTFLGWKGIEEAEAVVRAAVSAAGRG
jgi:inorganic pyrophosphatase